MTIFNIFQRLTIATMSSTLDVGNGAGSASVFFLFLLPQKCFLYSRIFLQKTIPYERLTFEQIEMIKLNNHILECNELNL